MTNSNLELAATIAQHDIIAHDADTRECTLHNGHDNMPAVFWQHRGSTTTHGPATYPLQLQALHQCFHHYVPQHGYIPGPVNIMANDCSCHWDLTDAQLLTYFNSAYPQPISWKLLTLQLLMNLALISVLSKQ